MKSFFRGTPHTRAFVVLSLVLSFGLVTGCGMSNSASNTKRKTSQKGKGSKGSGNTDDGEGNVSPASPLKRTEARVQLGTRWMVASALNDIFGSETALNGGAKVKDVVKQYVLNQPASWGGPCDPYADSHPIPTKQSDGGIRRIVGNKSEHGCNEPTVSQMSIQPSASTSRLAWNTRVCDRIAASDAAIKNAAAQAGVDGATTLTTPPSDPQILSLYELFYTGQEPSAAVLGELKSVVTIANGLYPNTIEPWRFLTLTLCLSPGWQVL